MISGIARHYLPFSLPSGEASYPVLSRISVDLESCRTGQSVGRVLEYWKPILYAHLRWRFSETEAQAVALKALNILLARYHLWRRSSIVGSRPMGLVVDPSNVCQLACPGCVHSSRSELLQIFDWRKGTLQPDRFSALLQSFGPYAIGVYFCNYGEPLLNLRTPALIRQAKTYLIQTALSTSLSVSKFDAEAYVESGLDYMAMAIDGASQAVYQRFRQKGNLELVLENVRRLVDTKRRLRKKTPALCWNFLAFEHNAHEIPAASRLAAQLGIDQFRVVEPFDVSWDDPDIRPAKVAPGVRRFSWTSRIAIAANWNPFPGELAKDAIEEEFHRCWTVEESEKAAEGAQTCHWLYKNMVMDATGRILPCCAAPAPDRDLVFAQFDTGAGDPYNSAKYRKAREYFAVGKPPQPDSPYCAKCPWVNSPVNIGEQHIWIYFRSADAALFDRKSLELLANW